MNSELPPSLTKNPRDPLFHRFTTTDIRIHSCFKLWRDWLACHTIDPNEVYSHGWVYRSLKNYTVMYQAIEIDHTEKCTPHRVKYKTHNTPNGLDVVTSTKTMRLESAPMVFPYPAIDRIIHDLSQLSQLQPTTDEIERVISE